MLAFTTMTSWSPNNKVIWKASTIQTVHQRKSKKKRNLFLVFYGVWRAFHKWYLVTNQDNLLRIFRLRSIPCIFMRCLLVWNLYCWQIQLQDLRRPRWQGKHMDPTSKSLANNSSYHILDQRNKTRQSWLINFLSSINKCMYPWLSEITHFAKCKPKSSVKRSAWRSNNSSTETNDIFQK